MQNADRNISQLRARLCGVVGENSLAKGGVSGKGRGSDLLRALHYTLLLLTDTTNILTLKAKII